MSGHTPWREVRLKKALATALQQAKMAAEHIAEKRWDEVDLGEVAEYVAAHPAVRAALDARAVAVREVPYAGMTFVDDEAGSADSLDAAVVKAAKAWRARMRQSGDDWTWHEEAALAVAVDALRAAGRGTEP